LNVALFLLRFYAEKVFLSATANPEFSKNVVPPKGLLPGFPVRTSSASREGHGPTISIPRNALTAYEW
jgi:hypothetical protein